MRHLPAIILTLTLLLVSAAAQTKSVLKTISNNQLTESLSVKAGTTFTIPVGATINNLGTATGFGSGGTWGSITGTLSNQTDLNTALGLKAPLASPTFTGTATAPTVTTTNNLFPTRTLGLLSGTSVYWDNCEGTGYAVALRPITPTANRALYLPNADGTLVSTGDTGTVTNAMLAGSIDLTAKITGTLPVANGGTGITSLGTGVATALGVSTGTAGAFVVNGGALGTPSSGTVTNLTGTASININGTVGATTPTTGAFTSLVNSGLQTSTGGSNSATPTNLHLLTNTTAATVGVQSASPSVIWTGAGWKTTATAASQPVSYRAYVLPVQGTTAPSASWVLGSDINATGTYTNRLAINSDDGITVTSAGSAGTVGTLTSAYGSCTMGIGGTGLRLSSLVSTGGGSFQIDSGGGNPSIIYTDGTDVLQVGADAATPTSQGFKGADGSGTDKTGSQLNIGGGKGTGTGRGGDVVVKTTNASTTGSTAQSYSTRRFDSAKFVDLTESTATLFCNIAVASAKYAGARLICTITANDGTDYQSLTSQVTVDAVNKAGTVTATLTQVDNTTAASAGTLTCTYTAVANGNTVDIKANAVSSLTQTVLRAKWSVISLNTDGADTAINSGSLITPQ